MDWLRIHRGEAPLIVAFPHGGTGLAAREDAFVSAWRARFDTDWWIENLYGFVRDFGATTIATDISRSIIDMNRDPSGASLYPGQATTELCPTTTFDGDPLYIEGTPSAGEIEQRRRARLTACQPESSRDIGRLSARAGTGVVYGARDLRGG